MANSEDGVGLHVLVFLVLSAIDISFNAAAGPAAVAAGAHVNGSPVTHYALRLGAVAAVTKSGILAFVGFLGLANINMVAYGLLVILSTSFGISVLITAQVSNLVLGEVPTSLLIAAVVAALPLLNESVGMYFSSAGFAEASSGGELDLCGYFQGYLCAIGFDALGGYTFAAMAQNEGMRICDVKAAAAAGGVYGVLSVIPKLMANITWIVAYDD